MYSLYKRNSLYLKISSLVFFFVYCVFYVFISRFLLDINTEMAIVIILTALLPLFFFINEILEEKIDTNIFMISSSIMIIGKIVYVVLLDPLTTLDATRYYAQVIQYQNNLNYFLEFFWAEFKTKHVMSSAYPSFGIVYLPFYHLFNTDSKLLIVILNSISLILISYFTFSIIRKHFWLKFENNTLFVSIIAGGILISPILMYWSSTFSKDIFSVLIIIISLYLLLEKRYFLFLIFTIYATMLRPYSFVIILLYYAFYKGTGKVMWIGIISSVAVVGYFIGFTGIINIFNTAVYLIASPNPFSLDNWKGFFIIEIEILFIIAMLFFSAYVYINDKKSRKFYLLAIGAFIIYSCVMTLVGFGVIDSRDQVYSLGIVGDDISRKKIPIIILYYTVICYTIINLRVSLRVR